MKDKTPSRCAPWAASPCAALILNAGLVDRFRVVVFPVITGNSGRERIYDGYPDVALDMISSRTFDGRIQLLEYVPTSLAGPLYRHVEDKDDLVNAVVAEVLSGASVPEGDLNDWEGRVVGYLRSLRAQALAHPALSSILAEHGLTVGPVFDQLEAIHGILRAAGFSDVDAVRTFYALFT